MSPVEALSDKPAAELNVPPPVNPKPRIATGLVPLAHTGVAYENDVTGVVVGSIVMLAVLLPATAHPDAATE